MSNNNIKYGIVPGIIGKQIGLKAGDKITAINGKPIVRFDDLISMKVLLNTTVFTVDRNGQDMQVAVPGNILDKISDYGMGEFIIPRTKFSVDSVLKGSKAQLAGITFRIAARRRDSARALA